MTAARFWNLAAWSCLAGWFVCVFLEHRAKAARDEDLDNLEQRRNGNGATTPKERELDLDLEELNRP